MWNPDGRFWGLGHGCLVVGTRSAEQESNHYGGEKRKSNLDERSLGLGHECQVVGTLQFEPESSRYGGGC